MSLRLRFSNRPVLFLGLLISLVFNCSTAQTFNFKFIHEKTDPFPEFPAHQSISLSVMASNGIHQARAKALLPGEEMWDYTWGPFWAPHPEGEYELRIACIFFNSMGMHYVQQRTELETSLRVDNGSPPEIFIRVFCPFNHGKLEQPVFIKPRATIK